MSDINNQSNNLYTIDTVQDLSLESAAAIQGGAAVELYDKSNFRDQLLSTDRGTANVGSRINDRVTSIVINEGVWEFYTESNFRGASTKLRKGRYANIGLGLIPNDSITSFRRVG
jgi:hypothetical protein